MCGSLVTDTGKKLSNVFFTSPFLLLFSATALVVRDIKVPFFPTKSYRNIPGTLKIHLTKGSILLLFGQLFHERLSTLTLCRFIFDSRANNGERPNNTEPLARYNHCCAISNRSKEFECQFLSSICNSNSLLRIFRHLLLPHF